MCDICKAAVDPKEDYEGDLLDMPLRMNDKAIGYIQVGIQRGISEEPELFADMDINGESTVYDSVKINYCPICGQKLTD